jgi:hypothetical protein
LFTDLYVLAFPILPPIRALVLVLIRQCGESRK